MSTAQLKVNLKFDIFILFTVCGGKGSLTVECYYWILV